MGRNDSTEVPSVEPRESVHVREINADHLASGIEHRTATAAMGRGRIVDELVIDHVAEMSVSDRGANQGQRRQVFGCTNIILPIGQPLVHVSRRFCQHPGNSHGIADEHNHLSRRTDRSRQRQYREIPDSIQAFHAQDG